MRSRSTTFGRGLFLGAAVGAALVAQTLSASAQETLRVGKAFAGSFAYALIDVGVKQGFFEKQGLKLEISAFPGGAKLQQGLAADAVDIGLSGGTDMALTAKGAPMKAVAVIMVGVEQVALVAANSRFKSIDDFKGSTWMAPAKASMPGWLPVEMAIQKGWGPEGVKIQTGAPPDTAVALVKTGQLDALTQDPATALRLQKTGDFRIAFKFGDIIPNFFQYALFATDKVQTQKPEALKKFLAAWFQTIAFAKANKDETVKTISVAINVPEEFVSQVYDLAIKKYSDNGKFDAATLDVMSKAFLTSGMLETAPDMKTLYTEAFLP